MDKPRHFKLKVTTFDSTLFRLFFNSFVTPNIFKNDEQLEVIEYSAYEQLKKENADLSVNFKNVKSISESRESIINSLISENAKQNSEIEQLKSKLKLAAEALNDLFNKAKDGSHYESIAREALKEIES